MKCGWNGCEKESTGVWEITDSFGRTYRRDACDECAVYWVKHREKAVKLINLKPGDQEWPNLDKFKANGGDV